MINSVAFSNQMLEGARNCVVNCGGVEQGMEVLILNLVNDPGSPVEELAVHALATAAQEVGAKPQILWATGLEKGWWDHPSPIVVGAFRGANVVINNTPIGRPMKLIRDIMFREGVVNVRNMVTTAEGLSSAWARFPFQLTEDIMRVAGQRIENASKWRVTAPNGTDISGELAPPSGSQSGMDKHTTPRGATKNRPFPPGCLNPITSINANGVIVTERTLPVESRHLGVGEMSFERYVRITIENNRIAHIEGGSDADALQRFYEEMQEQIGDDAWNLSSFHAGLNPKSRLMLAPATNPDLWHRFKHNHPSVMHFHLGGSKLVHEYDYPFMFHISLEVDDHTMYLDGQKLYDNGEFLVLQDPEIRALATKYGNPEELLRTVALPPMPKPPKG